MSEKTENIFYKSRDRDAARYVSKTTVYEEALDHGRWVGLYFSATGLIQRENIVDTLPELDSRRWPIDAFDLEIDGQCCHNHWSFSKSWQRDGKRKGIAESVVELDLSRL